MKRNSVEYISVNFFRQSGRTEKRLIKSNMCACEAFRWKRIATENVTFTELSIYIWYSLF